VAGWAARCSAELTRHPLSPRTPLRLHSDRQAILMPEYLIGVMFHEPDAFALWNQGSIEDYESTTGIFIEAESTEAALAWGERIGESLLQYLNHDSTLNWKKLGYFCWVEESPSTCSWKHCLSFFQHVPVGQMPDFDRMTADAYEKWAEASQR
jgi:hypothetical protein